MAERCLDFLDLADRLIETAEVKRLELRKRYRRALAERTVKRIQEEPEFRAVKQTLLTNVDIPISAHPELPGKARVLQAGFRLMAFFFVSLSCLVIAITATQGTKATTWWGSHWPKTTGSIHDRLAETATAGVHGLGFGSLPHPLAFAVIAIPAVFTLYLLISSARFTASAWRYWRLAVRDALVPTVRTAYNRHANTNSPETLLVDSAPGLGDCDTTERLVLRSEKTRVTDLFERLGVKSIAVSGARGVGKTTLLKVLAEPQLTVCAPVSYNPLDFLVHLHARVCEHAIRVCRGYSRRWPARLCALIRRPLRLAAVAGIVTLWARTLPAPVADFLGQAGFPAPTPITVRVLSTISLFACYGFLGKLRTGKLPRDTRAIRRSAANALCRLRYVQSDAVERSSQLKKTWLDLGRKRTRQLTDKPITLPDLVSEYLEFVERFVKWLRQSRHDENLYLTIAIDEVDRISQAEAAERFINDIKAIFDTRHCRYIVTVSEDALAGFEQRVVRIRPALDSAFDEVLRLSEFTYPQSVDLLERSVVGFSRSFVALCHCVSGGIPRDLVRAARALIDIRRSSDEAGLQALAVSLVTHEIQGFKRGLLPRVAALGDDDGLELEDVCSKLADPVWPGTDTTRILDEASVLLSCSKLGATAKRATSDLAAVVYYYATVQDLFTDYHEVLRKEEALATEVPEPGQVRTLDEMAAIRSLLPVSTQLANLRLTNLRHGIGMPTIPRH